MTPTPALLPAECRLLLACAGDRDPSSVAELLAEPLDWPTVMRVAEREKIVPSLHRLLQGAPSGTVPAAVAGRLHALARVTDFKMLYMEQRVAESAAALARAGIPHALLKGAALAVSAYGSFARRPMVDFDVLVHPDDAGRALAVLLDTGWVWRRDRDPDADYSHLHHLPALLDARGVEISLELHTAILPAGQPFRLDAVDVLRDTRPAAGAMRVPAREHLLLHACIHFAWAHMLRKGALRTFRDVGVLLATSVIDPAAFARAAARTQATTACYWTLRLARSLTGAAVPGELLAALRPALPEAVLRSCERHFAIVLFPEVGLGCPSVRLRRVMWSTAMRPGRSGHGESRPWDVLALRSEDQGRHDPMTVGTGPGERVPGWWRRYVRAVLLAAGPGRRAA